jgi:hypothetical protein
MLKVTLNQHFTFVLGAFCKIEVNSLQPASSNRLILSSQNAYSGEFSAARPRKVQSCKQTFRAFCKPTSKHLALAGTLQANILKTVIGGQWSERHGPVAES